MQGAYGHRAQRFPSKKALRAAVDLGDPVYLEATSLFGNEYGGSVTEAPDGTYFVVGPDPHTSRKWYAQVIKNGEKIIVK